MTILSDVKALGQQIWLDNLSRSLIQSGELAKMLQQGVCGVTSNPALNLDGVTPKRCLNARFKADGLE